MLPFFLDVFSGRRVLALLAGFALVGTFSACLDLSPITATGSAPLGDAGLSDSHVQGPCEACGFADGGNPEPECVKDNADCAGDPVCNAIIVCMRATGCFEVLAGEEANRCGLPCVLGAGVSAPTDPSLGLALDVVGCVASRCPAVCFPETRDAESVP
jgi:hypothetical protein